MGTYYTVAKSGLELPFYGKNCGHEHSQIKKAVHCLLQFNRISKGYMIYKKNDGYYEAGKWHKSIEPVIKQEDFTTPEKEAIAKHMKYYLQRYTNYQQSTNVVDQLRAIETEKDV